jgi:hypothetical protein
MNHPMPFRPEEHAIYDDGRMGKSTLFQSDRLLVGLNAFEPGQEHRLHAHAGMDKVYHVLAGSPWRRGRCSSPPKACCTASATPATSACWCWPSWRRRRRAAA